MEKTNREFKIIEGNLDDYDSNLHKDCIYLSDKGSYFIYNGFIYGSTEFDSESVGLYKDGEIIKSTSSDKKFDLFEDQYIDSTSLIEYEMQIKPMSVTSFNTKKVKDTPAGMIETDLNGLPKFSDMALFNIGTDQNEMLFLLNKDAGRLAFKTNNKWFILIDTIKFIQLETKVMQLETKFIQLDERIKALEEASELKEEK